MASDSADTKVLFGMYTGLTVGEISKLPDGETYLLGLIKNRFTGKPLKQAIQDFYKLKETVHRR